jgi:hypothetical protein
MLRPHKLSMLAACFILSVPYVASAATVASVTGTVLVSKGDGFAPITSATEIPAGGKVLVQPGGLAMITYPSDCAVRVGAGIWQVQPSAPCANGNHEVDFTGRMNDGMGPGPYSPPPPAEYDNSWLLIGGGAVAIGLIVACAADWCTSNKHHHPASP